MASTSKQTTPQFHKMKPKPRDYTDRILAVVAFASIIAAWILGGILNRSQQPECQLDLLPGATECHAIADGVFEGVAVSADGTETVVGWESVSSAPGYAGAIQTMVSVSPAGEILGVDVLHHTETLSFFSRVADGDFLADFAGMQANAPFELGADVDAVTRATVSSEAITRAVREASYTVAEAQLGMQVNRPAEPIRFGIPEITLLALYVVGFFAHRRGFKHKKAVRWATMLTGILVLGFIYNSPLTIGHFNALLVGYVPNWRTNLYWFMLLGGIIFVMTADGKNPYCSWFCPFGATQEVLNVIGGAKYLRPRKGKDLLKWSQRGLAWLAIVVALLLRNPGVSSYEVFGNLFAFNGHLLQWIVLGIVLLMSLFVRRPWCNFLCPVDPVTDFIAAVRRWMKELWTKRTRTRKTSASALTQSSSD